MSDANPSEMGPPEGGDDPQPLSSWSRIVAGLVGVILCGAGTAAVFVTENQAGCVALVLVGSVFALLAIAGNPLHSLGHGDTQMRFAVQKRRDQALERISEAPPAEAQRALDILQTVDPPAARESSFRYESMRAYDGLIRQRLLHLFADSAIQSAQHDGHAVDFYMYRPADIVVGVDVRFRPSANHGSKNSITTRVIHEIVGRSVGSVVPTLLVSNQPITSEAATALASARTSGANLAFAQWRDERDDEELKSKVEELFPT